MSSTAPPSYYFNNIDFNSTFFNTTTLSPYLKKNVPDTATALQTFSGGISTDSISTTGILMLGNTSSTITIQGAMNLPNIVNFYSPTGTPSANVTLSNTANNMRYLSFGGIKYIVGNFRVTYSVAVLNTGIISFTLPTFLSAVYSCSIGQTLISNTNLGYYSCVSNATATSISFYIVASALPTVGNFVGISYFITGI